MMRKILKLIFFAIFLEFFTKILNANGGKFVAKNPAEINSFLKFPIMLLSPWFFRIFLKNHLNSLKVNFTQKTNKIDIKWEDNSVLLLQKTTFVHVSYCTAATLKLFNRSHSNDTA